MDFKANPAMLGLIIAAGLISLLGFSRREVMDALIFSPSRIISRGQYHRLVTSGFLHADWVHFAFNAFSLYSFGGPIEAKYGTPFLLVIFFSAVVGGNLLSLLLHRRQENYLALGASGGVCGVIFASVFLIPGGSLIVVPIPVPIPAAAYAVLFLLISMYGIQSKGDNVGHDAHLGGAIVGLLVTTAYHPEIVRTDPRLYAAVMGLSIVFFIFLVRQSSRQI